VTLASGVPFVSDQQLEAALDEANVPPRQADAAMEHYRSARINGLESALAILALASVLALFATRRLPRIQPADEVAEAMESAPLTPAAAPPSPA
jgi:hypothetical protein